MNVIFITLHRTRIEKHPGSDRGWHRRVLNILTRHARLACPGLDPGTRHLSLKYQKTPGTKQGQHHFLINTVFVEWITPFEISCWRISIGLSSIFTLPSFTVTSNSLPFNVVNLSASFRCPKRLHAQRAWMFRTFKPLTRRLTLNISNALSISVVFLFIL